MNIAEFCIKNKVSTIVVTILMVVGGIYCYQGLGRLEDPEFTIKDALITTTYPGATAVEVEKEVTDLLEKAVQQLGQLDYIESKSELGLSTLTVTIKDKYNKATLPQVWDELRRKVNDAQSDLPPGAGESVVVDDYGDVFGVFLAITGDGYSYRELEDVADFFQRELLLAEDVSKISLYGIQKQVVYVEPIRDKLALFGIQKQDIYDILEEKNLVENSGSFEVDKEFIQLSPTGEFQEVEEFGGLLIAGDKNSVNKGERLVFLRDVANIYRDYAEPPKNILYVNGLPAVSIAVSTAAGGNVVVMGDSLKERFDAIKPLLPEGINLEIISLQSKSVTQSIQGFISSLIQAVAIVIIVLMLFMGLRSAILIGVVLVVTIVGTFILMDHYGVMLERISLGALIIALGMLVDNAIVVTDGILVRIQRGMDKVQAATNVVSQNMIPLLGATVIAVLAFAAIGTSQDSTGEYCRSLFQVILYSLMLSWVVAVTVTPLLCMDFLKASVVKEGQENDEYGGKIYGLYRSALTLCLKFRWITVGVMAVLLLTALYGFKSVDRTFFPNSTRPQFMVDFWMPEGTHIRETEKNALKVQEYLRSLDNVTQVATFVGQGAPRFLLTYSPEKANSAYTYFMVSVDDYRVIDGMTSKVENGIEELFPESIPLAYKFVLGPGDPYKLQFRFLGPDYNVLRELASQAEQAMLDDGQVIGVQTDCRDMVKTYRPILSEVQARRNGIERADVSEVLHEAYEGRSIGVYRDGTKLLPIISRAPAEEQDDARQINNLYIWSPLAGQNIPLSQVTNGFKTVYEDSIVMRRNRIRMITVKGNPGEGAVATKILKRLMPKINTIKLPPGYKYEIAGEYDDSSKAQTALLGSLPPFVVMMVLISIFLFNSIRQPLIIWCCVPLAIIGVTAGLLIAKQPFGFMSLLGLLSLSGMLIKNAVVLIDEINTEIAEGKDIYTAIIDSGVCRARPVMMAAATTVLGMAPLLPDAFFVSMAVTIMAGLTFASVLTLVIVPVLFAILYKAHPPKNPTPTPPTPEPQQQTA
jgi:multidrug efflux pump subunit AcrB